MTKGEQYIEDERKFIIFYLKALRGYDNATIAKILFSTSRSNITRFMQSHVEEYKEYIKNNPIEN